jgi:hypothetical protein
MNSRNRPIGRVYPIHCASKFVWTGHLGIVDASDLGPDFCTSHEGGPKGFIVRSPRTGVEKPFVWSTNRYSDGELTCSVFTTQDGLFMVEIYND